MSSSAVSSLESITHARLDRLEQRYGNPQLWNQLDPGQVESLSDWMLIHQARRAWGDHPELTRPPQGVLARTAEHLSVAPFVLLDVPAELLARRAWRHAHAPRAASTPVNRSAGPQTL